MKQIFKRIFRRIKADVKLAFFLRKWRRTIREGDKVCIAKVHEVEVRVLDAKAGEVTIWDPMIREYETYPLCKLYPAESCQ